MPLPCAYSVEYAHTRGPGAAYRTEYETCRHHAGTMCLRAGTAARCSLVISCSLPPTTPNVLDNGQCEMTDGREHEIMTRWREGMLASMRFAASMRVAVCRPHQPGIVPRTQPGTDLGTNG